ncbi:hypothetical protein PRIPAC_95274, partial [Pristionchus pacificus]|uniref:G protein-coupled receptor n=1 Tax=Pristionchus pacificus TaxID=54126 RepID=A0A2A6D1M0_PRIPA
MNDIGWLSLHAIYAVLVVVAAAGICLNALLLLTTALTTSLRSAAHILIGCCALFDTLHELHAGIAHVESVLGSSTFAGLNLGFIPSLGRSAGVVCAFCIGIDRMLYMFDVAAYDRMKKKHMLAANIIQRLKRIRRLLQYHFLSIALFCLWTVFLMIANWTPRQQICTMLAPFHGDSRVLWWNTISGIYIITSLFYSVAWQTVKWRGDAASQQHHDNLFTSITVVIIVEVSAWFISSILVDLSRHYVAPDHRPPIHYLSCVLVSSGIAAKPILLYLQCAEYRRAMHELFTQKESHEEPDVICVHRRATD